jgi:large subunit ribosomal protein L32
MAPLPKRKHSTKRSGKRKAANVKSLVQLIKCKNCGKAKIPHRICKYCKK